MTDVEALVDRYCDGWSASDPEERGRILRSVLDADVMYCDPRCQPLALDALLRHVDQVHGSRPGTRILRISHVDMHHGIARFAWHMRLTDGRTLPESLDVIELVGDRSRILRITGFFGPLAPRSLGAYGGKESI